MKQRGAWCNVCQQQRLFTAPTPSHLLHLVLTLITFGLWLIVWLIIEDWPLPLLRLRHAAGQAPAGCARGTAASGRTSQSVRMFSDLLRQDRQRAA